MASSCKRWLWHVYQQTRATGREGLHSYFRGQTKKHDLTPVIMNMISNAVKAVIPAETSDERHCNLSPDSTQDWTIDKQQCVTYLYCQVADHLLQDAFPQQQSLLPETGEAAAKRFKGLVRAQHNPECYEIIRSHEFHLPLVECALHVLAYITEGSDQQYPWATEVLQRQNCAPTLWWAARSFQACFSPDSSFPMPDEIRQHLQQMQTVLLDQPLLATGSLVFSIMEHGGGGICKDGDTGLVTEVLRAYADQAVQRAQMLGWHLQRQQQMQAVDALQLASSLHHQASQEQQLPETFHERCAWLMDRLLLEHHDICFGVHMSMVVACVAYLAAKLLQANITLKHVTEATLLCASHTPAEVFQHAEVSRGQQATDAVVCGPAEHGDIRSFYNKRFLPPIRSTARQYMQDYEQMVQTITATAAPDGSPSQPAATDLGAPASRQPLAGLVQNQVTATVILPGKAPACIKGGKGGDFAGDSVMEDVGVENMRPTAAVKGGSSSAPGKLHGVACQPALTSTGVTPTRHMR